MVKSIFSLTIALTVFVFSTFATNFLSSNGPARATSIDRKFKNVKKVSFAFHVSSDENFIYKPGGRLKIVRKLNKAIAEYASGKLPNVDVGFFRGDMLDILIVRTKIYICCATETHYFAAVQTVYERQLKVGNRIEHDLSSGNLFGFKIAKENSMITENILREIKNYTEKRTIAFIIENSQFDN